MKFGPRHPGQWLGAAGLSAAGLRWADSLPWPAALALIVFCLLLWTAQRVYFDGAPAYRDWKAALRPEPSASPCDVLASPAGAADGAVHPLPGASTSPEAQREAA